MKVLRLIQPHPYEQSVALSLPGSRRNPILPELGNRKDPQAGPPPCRPAGALVEVGTDALYAPNVVALDRTPAPSPNDWLSAKQAGELLGVSARSVGRWIRANKLRARVTEGGQFRVTRADVERLAAAQESRAVQAPAPAPQRRKEDRTPPPS